MGRYLINGTNNYFYNSDDLCIEFVTVKGKIKKCDNIVRNGVMFGKYKLPLDNGRVKIISRPLYYFHVKYHMGIDISDKIVSFKDYDANNLDNNNITVSSIYDSCDKWKKLDDEYMLSINGDVYSFKLLKFLEHPLNGAYFNIKGKPVHRLVWELFNGECIKDGYVIDHIDNRIYNNRLDNLQMITQSENIKKERSIDLDSNFTFICSYMDKKYYIYTNYGKRYSRNDHERIYNNFINKCKDGNIDDYFIESNFIKYDFLECKWRIIHVPIECRNGLKKSDFYGLRFDDYNSAKEWLKQKCDFSKEIDSDDRFNFFKVRGEIFFRYKYKNYSLRLSNGVDENFDKKVINLFLNEGKETFINLIPELRLERESIIKDKKDAEKKYRSEKYVENLESIKKIKSLNLKEKIKENSIKLAEFNSAPNYHINSNAYHFVPHYNGKTYNIGNLYDKSIAFKFNDLLDAHKLDCSFDNWYNSEEFKSVWSHFKNEDTKIRLTNEKNVSKGYRWYGPRNCWRSLFKLNGKEYMLGYFHSENSCKAIYSEACKMIELGVFEKWYSDIKSHRERIKKYFE